VPLQRNIRRRLSETVLPLDRPSICLSGLVTTSPLRLHQPSPIVFLLRVHSSRESTLVAAENFRIEPELAVEDYLDAFGNRCGRVNTPAGIIRFLSNAVVRDSGQPDAYAPEAEEDGMAEIPTDTLSFILPSRYCEVDSGLLDFAWKRFAAITPGRARVQAICDFVHSHLRFDYQMARANRTAVDAFKERVGVCRDFTHLAITLCRCLNIPARYVTGYLGDIGVPPLPDPLCDDRGQPSNAAVSWTLVNPEPDRHPADFSSLVLPMGRGGTLLAVPLLATFKIFCDRIEPLRRVGSFLGRP
jgi:transglutaminase-like putative cysteine protease